MRCNGHIDCCYLLFVIVNKIACISKTYIDYSDVPYDMTANVALLSSHNTKPILNLLNLSPNSGNTNIKTNYPPYKLRWVTAVYRYRHVII